MSEQPWMNLKEAAALFGMSVVGVKSAIQADRFPIPTYRLGRRVVMDRQVVERFFEEQRQAGLQELAFRPRRPKHFVRERRALESK